MSPVPALVLVRPSACLLAALAVAASAAEGDDVVHLRNGVEVRGSILSETREDVVVELRHGGSTSLSWERVASIDYDAPPSFEESADLATEGRFEEALDALHELGDAGELRRPLRQNVLFRRACLSASIGSVEQAARDYQALLAGFPKGRYLDEAVRGLVEADLALGRPAEAAAALDRLEAGANVRTRFAARLRLLRGLVFEAQRRLPEARVLLEAVERAEEAGVDERREAGLHLARILEAQGDAEGAQERFRALIANGAPPLVLAGAWNGIAARSLEEGLRLRDRALIEAALLQYMRGVVQYVPQPGDPVVELRTSLQGAARCSGLLAEVAADRSDRVLLRRREAEMERRLAELEP